MTAPPCPTWRRRSVHFGGVSGRRPSGSGKTFFLPTPLRLIPKQDHPHSGHTGPGCHPQSFSLVSVIVKRKSRDVRDDRSRSDDVRAERGVTSSSGAAAAAAAAGGGGGRNGADSSRSGATVTGCQLDAGWLFKNKCSWEGRALFTRNTSTFHASQTEGYLNPVCWVEACWSNFFFAPFSSVRTFSAQSVHFPTPKKLENTTHIVYLLFWFDVQSGAARTVCDSLEMTSHRDSSSCSFCQNKNLGETHFTRHQTVCELRSVSFTVNRGTAINTLNILSLQMRKCCYWRMFVNW